jgi:hypothetical protein
MKNKVTHQHHAAVGKLVPMIVACILAMAAGTARAQTATNFTIVNHATGQPLSLYDYQGNVVVLDFWAYWCEFCQEAALDMEPNITEYYRNAGGNTNGVPVQVISINIDCSCSSCESNYIYTYGLELVADDCNWVAYNQFTNGGIPQFAVINGTTNSVNYTPWQILSTPLGYLTNYTVPLLKSYIESVQTPAPIVTMISPTNGATVPAPNVTLNASLATSGKIITRVEFYNGATLIGSITNTAYMTITNDTGSNLTWNTNYSLTWSNVIVGAKSVSARAYYGATGTVNSSAVNFTVATPSFVAALSKKGTNVFLSWSGGAGTYQVLSSTNLSNGSWQNCGTAGTYTNMTLVPSNKSCFYRVMKQ